MNILVSKRYYATVITLASLGVGQFKKSLKKKWKSDEHFDGSAVLWQ